MAELLGLDALLERKPSQLSGGQQQRVALGRAIIAETPVCLMDEPLSNLDAQLRQEMRREIRALQQQLGMTMVYVTHDQTEAMSMADQVVLLRRRPDRAGRGAGRALRAAGAVFAARFIGTPPMNMRRRAGVGAEPASSAFGPSTCASSSAAAMRRRVVQSAEYLGADTIVTCSTSAPACSPTRSRHACPAATTLAEGTRLRLAWAAERQPPVRRRDRPRRDDVVAVPV